MKHTTFEIVRAQAQNAALLEYLKIVGGETENLSFGAEGVPTDAEEEEEERSYLDVQAQSCDHIQLFAKQTVRLSELPISTARKTV